MASRWRVRVPLMGGAVEGHGDHRLAMALAVAALGRTRPVDRLWRRGHRRQLPGLRDDAASAGRRRRSTQAATRVGDTGRHDPLLPPKPITAHTQIVGLIGWPVGHSVSPAMHNAAFDALGLDWRYLPFPVAPDPQDSRSVKLCAGCARWGYAEPMSLCHTNRPSCPSWTR